MRVWSPPCYLHYSVFCVVTCDQVLAWFRSSLHSDPLRRSCLFSLATEKTSATQGRCSPWKEKKKKKKKSARKLNLVEEKTGYALSRTSYTWLYINSMFLFFSPAMTTWFCVSSETTTMTVAGLVVVYLIFYFLMERKHSDSSSQYSETAEFKSIQYQELDQGSNTDSRHPPLITREAKLQAIKQILPPIICVVISWLSEFLVMQAVITTYAFPNSPFPPRDHYQYYITLFLTGEFIGRSYLGVVALIKEELISRLIVRRLWLLTIIEVCILVFCLFAAWYRFLPDVTVLLVISFFAGLIIGIMYANVLQVFTESYEFPLREFVLGFVAVATGMGILIAGLLGLVVEPVFRKHCLTITDLETYCFTRTDPNAASNVTSLCR